MRIENGSDETVVYGLPFSLQWSKTPGSPRVFPKLRAKPLSAGKAGGCLTFQIPADARPGLYRFSKAVVLESGARRRLTAELEVSSQ